MENVFFNEQENCKKQQFFDSSPIFSLSVWYYYQGKKVKRFPYQKDTPTFLELSTVFFDVFPILRDILMNWIQIWAAGFIEIASQNKLRLDKNGF